MCLAVPAKIERIEGRSAWVDLWGNKRVISLALVPEAAAGDYVLVHVGCAIQRISLEEAEETVRLLEEAYGSSE